MVAGNHDNGHVGACLVDVKHRVDVEVDSRIGRGGRVVDVAADEQGVGLVLAHDIGQLPQEVDLLLATVIAIEILAQVPITGVNECEHKY